MNCESNHLQRVVLDISHDQALKIAVLITKDIEDTSKIIQEICGNLEYFRCKLADLESLQRKLDNSIASYY